MNAVEASSQPKSKNTFKFAAKKSPQSFFFRINEHINFGTITGDDETKRRKK